MKRYILSVIILLLFESSLLAQSSGSWNLVWREDFGVVEDTVIRDFADNNKKVIGHTCASSISECTTINDMYYGIANSTWWAYNRPKTATCNQEAWHFMGGRDHTGNEKGAMLIVNVGNDSKDKQIYEQTIDFDLCQNKLYKFVIYAASITNPGYCDKSPTLSNLTMNVYNVKDPSNPVLLKTLETGDIPLWEMPLKADGSDDNSATGKGYRNPFATRDWSEFQIEFLAGDGDKLQLEVVNHKPGGCGNDFVIDDISLFRFDDKEVLDPTITTSTLSQESMSSSTGCAFVAKFSVPTEVLETWKEIYNQVYFLWQRSDDGGFTWHNMPTVSGIDKTTIEWEVPTGVAEVYRVIITGSTSGSDAKTEAEYIAIHGGPQDGCSYYSISNTLAGVSPVADCSFKENLKTIWKEDFGVMDKTILRTSSISKLNAYTTPGNKFEGNDYVITSDPYTAIGSQTNPKCYYDCDQKQLEKYYDHIDGDAVLYTRLLAGEESVVVEKKLSGPFCNCKNYIFSFKTITLSSWTEMKYNVLIQDGAGNVLVSEDIKVSGTGSPSWNQYVYSFVLPFDYTGDVTIQVVYQGNANSNVPVAFDDFRVSICQETVPQANLFVDNDPALKYVSGFDCEVTPPHLATVDGLEDWASQFPNYGYVWQMSRDGVTWQTIPESTRNHYCEDLEDGETLYRVVFGETKAVAQQVAANGKPTSPCSVYFITNSVGFFCKGVTCEAPSDITIVSSDADNVLCPGEAATLTPTKQLSATQFAQEWYKDGVLLSGYPKTTDQAVYSANEAGTYTVKVYDVENPTLEKCWKTAEIEITEAENPTVAITGGDDYCDGETVSAASFTFTGTHPFEFSYTDGKNSVTKTITETSFTAPVPTAVGEYSYKVSALSDAYCQAKAAGIASTTTITIKEQPTVSVTNDGPVCAGEPLSLQATCATTGVAYSWSGPNSYTSSVVSPTLTSSTTALTGDYTVTVSLNGCEANATTSVKINDLPTILTLESDKSAICPSEVANLTATVSDDATGTFTWKNAIGTGLTAIVENDGVTSQETKTVTLSYESAAGCKAVDKTATVTLNSKPIAPIVKDLSFCIDDAVETLTAVALTGATLNWYGTSATGGTAGAAPKTNTAVAATTNYYVSQTLYGCESDRSVLSVVVNSNLSPTISVDDADLCESESTKISLPQASSYTSIVWSGTAAALLNNVALSAPTFTAKNETTVQDYVISVAVEDAKGCKGNASATITVNPTPTVTLAATETELCELESTTITATPSETGGTGVWTGASKNTETTATYTATTVGDNSISYVYTSAKGCESTSQSTTVTVYAIPVAPTVAPVEYCKNTSGVAPLSATASGTLTWYDADGTKLSEAPTPSTATVGSQTYFVTQTEQGCTSEKASMVVTIHSLPTPVITLSKPEECEGQPISLSLNDSYKSQSWTCSPTNYLNSTTLATPTFLATAVNGNYTIAVSVVDEHNCSATANSAITINPIPSVSLSSFVPQCESVTDVQTITATVTPVGTQGTGTWNGATKATETTTTVTPKGLGAGSHTIEYSFISDKGCEADVVSTQAVVFEMPSVAIKASNNKPCQGGSNSDEVTITATGTTNLGTLLYASQSLQNLNSATGAFLPEDQTVGTHTITMIYTDEHSCRGTAELSIEVIARPVADVSMNSTSICDYASNMPLQVTIDGVTSSKGTWAGTGVNGSLFSPKTATAGGPYNLTYSYVDEATRCSAEPVSFQITVNHTDAPTVVSKSESKLNVSNQTQVPALEATGEKIKWYALNDTTSSVVLENSTFQPTYMEEDGHMKVGTYLAYATQTKNGCQSVPAEATLTITDCSVQAPIAVKYHACEGDESIEIQAVSTHIDEANIGWFAERNDIPSGTVANLAAGNPQGTGPSYTFSLAGKSAGTYTMYASEYDGTIGTECFSPATAVVVEVHALPNPHIDDLGIVCGGDEPKQVTYSPGTGSVLTGSGVVGNMWTPQFDASHTGTTTTTLTLTTTVPWGSGTDVVASCVNIATKDVTVTNVLAPTGTGIGTPQLWSIGSIASLPAMEIEYADGIGATLSVKNADNVEFATTSPIDLYPTEIQSVGSYSFAVTQQLNGCVSPIANSEYQIVECPTPTPMPESISICEGDALPSLAANGTGTPSYEWIDSTNTVVATTETVSVASLSGYTSKAGTYTFKVRQDGLDAAGNTCWGAYAEAKIIVNPLPEITITDPGVLCYSTGAYMMEATVNGKPASSISGGIWTVSEGSISSSGEINTSENGKQDGTYMVTYSYTDNNSCTNSNSQVFDIEYAEEPTTTPFTGIISHPVAVELLAENIEPSAIVQWYNSNKSQKLATDNPWQPGIDGTAVVSTSYYVSQVVRGCESEKVLQTVEIVDCPWTAPSVMNVEVCKDLTASEMIATAPANATPLEWKWYDANKNPLSSTTNSYAQTTTTSVGTTNYYVSYTAIESTSGEACESAPALVSTTVLNLPAITFAESSSIVCYASDAEEIVVSVDYGTNGKGSGLWAVTADADAISQSGVFSPKKNGEISDTYTISYSYIDGKGCENQANRTIDVIYLPAPNTTGHFTMTTQNKDAVVAAELQGGTTIHWFANLIGGSELGTGTSWVTGDKGNVAIDGKTYFAAQEKSGCFSERSEALVRIIDCPIPSVVISDESACLYDGAPMLVATGGTWTDIRPSGSVFRFYDAEKNGSLLKESADGTYTPSVTTAGEYHYWVSEYNGNIDPVGCEGPRKLVAITMKDVAAPIIGAKDAITSVCYGKENPLFMSQASQGTTYWFEEDPGNDGSPKTIETGTGKTYMSSMRDEGTHSIWAMQLFDGCYSNPVEATFVVKPIPDAPQTTDNEICYGESATAISAVGEADATIVWYADKSSTKELLRGSRGFQSKEILVGNYSYYATQVVNGCEGPAAVATYTIKPLPSAPTMVPQSNLCEYDSAPQLRAIGQNIRWYASDMNSEIGTGDLYQTTDMSVTTHRFYATQTVEGCEGPQAKVSFTVNAKPANPIVKGASMCAGDTVVPALSSNVDIDIWYADASATIRLNTGKTYVPDLSSVIGSMTYYVQRTQNTCVSDIVPVTLRVIPQPTFSIGDDITLCVYDSVAVIQASNFEPEITENSYMGWTVSLGRKSKAYVDNAEHFIQPNDMINEVGTYTISAYYRYKYDNVYCSSESQEISYTVKKRARTPIVFSSVICQGTNIDDLRALGSTNMTWKSLSGTSPEFCSGSRYKFEDKDLNVGLYQFEVYDIDYYDIEKNLGCESLHDTVSLTVAPAAKTKLFGADSVCVGATEQYYTQYTENSTYYWNVTGDNLNYSKDQLSSSVRYIDWINDGIDTLTVFEQTWAGCEGVDTLIVHIAPSPKAHFNWSLPGASNKIELRDSSMQDSLWTVNELGEKVGENIPYTLFWNFGHIGENEKNIDVEVPYEKRNIAILEEGYEYGYNCPILTVKNSFGCKDVYTECVFVNIATSLYMPTAFSPTNPAHSVRTFQPKGFNLKTCEVSVYDKWGNLIWYSDAVEDGMFVGSWDGKYDGKIMQSGVYIWKMEATFLDGQVWEGFDVGNGKKAKFGSVSLIR